METYYEIEKRGLERQQEMLHAADQARKARLALTGQAAHPSVVANVVAAANQVVAAVQAIRTARPAKVTTTQPLGSRV